MRSRLFAVCAAFLFGWPAIAPADVLSDFPAVCDALRAVTFVQAGFREEKTLHILSHPLQSQGTLMFSPQRGVYRVMEKPVRQEMLITRKSLISKNAQGVVERMNVNRQPMAKAFVQVFLSFFSGDEEAWRKHFEFTFSGTREDWTIEFSPKANSAMDKAIRTIVLQGSEGVLKSMTLTEANGDSTRTVYEQARVFRGTEGEEPLRQFPTDLQ